MNPSAPTSIPRPKPCQFTRLQTLWLIRRLRKERRALKDDLLLVEERIRGGHNGPLNGVHIALSADLMIAREITGELWRSIM